MDNVVFLVFRRMRAPLITLILTYTVAILGLVLIPGRDAQGIPWQMDVFHAFYFVAYMSTTIGFGEIPYELTDAQRMWVIFCIFATVVVWLYSIGTVLALLQDQTFRRAVTERRFARRVRRRREPFYLVCGYGETGSALVRSLTDHNQHAVAIDIQEDRINALKLENLRELVPALCADARTPRHLLAAGLRHPLCTGVAALTNVNETNLKVAIAAKLMHPEIRVICRADSHDVEANMASFGTDHIYDPFDIFALYLVTAIQAPCLVTLQEWLTGLGGERLKVPVYPPANGLWILCGFGRFGKAVHQHLRRLQGIELVVVERTPEKTGLPTGCGCVVGRGTEAATLKEAGIARAVGLVAGTDDDANNLSIVMTARDLNRRLFVVTRENQIENHDLFEAVAADLVMHPSSIVAHRIRVLLSTPLLHDFEHHASFQEHDWSCALASRIAAVVDDQVPAVWEVAIDDAEAHAVRAVLPGHQVTLGALLRDARDREHRLPVIPLLLARNRERELLPGENLRLHPGDRLLLCGSDRARPRMEWTQQNAHALRYVLTGESAHEGPVWRWIRATSSRLRMDRT